MLALLRAEALLALLALLALTWPFSSLVNAAKLVTCGDYETLDVGTSFDVDNKGTWPCQINFNVNNRYVKQH